MERLHKKIRQKLLNYKNIKNFLLTSRLSNTYNIQYSNQNFLDLYNPITNTQTFAADILIEWNNGKISKITISDPDKLDVIIKKAENNPYKDEEAKSFLPQPKNLVITKQKSCKIYNKHYDINSLIYKVKELQQLTNNIRMTYSAYGGLMIVTNRLTVSNSNNLNLEQFSTYFTIGGGIFHHVWLAYSSRQIKELLINDKLSQLKDLINYLAPLSQQTNSSHKLGLSLVLLAPGVFEELFEHFILENIFANAIYDKSSKYTLNDFEKTQIAPKNFELTVYPTKEMTPGAASFANDGWPYPKKFTFIKNGILQHPIASHKYAKLLKIKRTPSISDYKLINFGKIEHQKPVLDTIKQMQEVIVIDTLLNVHTHNKHEDYFSFTCPNALVIKNGKLVSTMPVQISGYFSKILNSLKTIYRDTIDDDPYIGTNSIEVKKPA